MHVRSHARAPLILQGDARTIRDALIRFACEVPLDGPVPRTHLTWSYFSSNPLAYENKALRIVGAVIIDVGSKKGAVDVALKGAASSLLEMHQLSPTPNHVVVIVSGDADFAHEIRALQLVGLRVAILCNAHAHKSYVEEAAFSRVWSDLVAEAHALSGRGNDAADDDGEPVRRSRQPTAGPHGPRLCVNYANGDCRHGDACHFAHKRRGIPPDTGAVAMRTGKARIAASTSGRPTTAAVDVTSKTKAASTEAGASVKTATAGTRRAKTTETGDGKVAKTATARNTRAKAESTSGRTATAETGNSATAKTATAKTATAKSATAKTATAMSATAETTAAGDGKVAKPATAKTAAAGDGKSAKPATAKTTAAGDSKSAKPATAKATAAGDGKSARTATAKATAAGGGSAAETAATKTATAKSATTGSGAPVKSPTATETAAAKATAAKMWCDAIVRALRSEGLVGQRMPTTELGILAKTLRPATPAGESLSLEASLKADNRFEVEGSGPAGVVRLRR